MAFNSVEQIRPAATKRLFMMTDRQPAQYFRVMYALLYPS